MLALPKALALPGGRRERQLRPWSGEGASAVCRGAGSMRLHTIGAVGQAGTPSARAPGCH